MQVINQKTKSIKIQWLGGKEYKFFVGKNKTVSFLDFQEGKIYCVKYGKLHFDFDNQKKTPLDKQ